jgi:Type I phosphodiesterase / nucleotide pyrophosphatase
VWSMNSPEMGDAVKYQDEALRRFVTFLDANVGKNAWAMVVTADHAAMPDPGVSGGYQISTAPIEAGIEAMFDQDGDGVPVVNLIQPAQAFLNTAELEQNGFDTADVARYVMSLTQQDTAGGGVEPEPGHEGDAVFQAVFPSELMTSLPCLPEAKRDRTVEA